MIKRVALTLCSIASLLNSDVNAMNSKSAAATEANQDKVFVRLLDINTVPPVEVIQIPDAKKVILGGFIAPEINLSCNTYNGIPTTGPINLRYDMSRDEMATSLFTAFGSDKKIEVSEGMCPISSLPWALINK